MFAKDTNSFRYFLRRICDFDEKFEKYSAEYQNYLTTKDYKPGKKKKQLSDIKKLTGEDARYLNYVKPHFLLHAI